MPTFTALIPPGLKLPFSTLYKTLLVTVFVIVSLLFSSTSVLATTYYVDATGGDDSNTGTATDEAWQTLSQVQSSTFTAGDQILLKRGEIWREQLVFPSSGSSGSPIVIGDYGSGTKPTIYGSDLLDGSWTNTSGTIYKISLTTTAQTVVNGTTNLTENDGNYATLSDGEWDWYNDELYVNIGSDPTGGTIQAGQRNYGISLSAKNYVTISNIIIRNVNGSAIYLASTSNNIIVNDTEGYSNGNEAFKLVNSASGTFNRVIGNYNLDDGFSLHNSATATINTGTFSNNISGIQNIDTSQITADDLTIANNTNGFQLLNGSATGTVTNSTFTDNTYGIQFNNDTTGSVTGTTVTGGTYAIWLQTTGDITVTQLTTSGTSNSTIVHQGTGLLTMSRCLLTTSGNHTIDVLTGASLVLNYSIIHDVVAASKYSVVARTGSQVTIKNSVFYNNPHGLFVADTGTISLSNSILTELGNAILFSGSADADSVTLSNNDFYNNTTDFNGASPTNTNGLAVDPLFTAAGSADFTLQRTSTLINAGVDVSLTTDYAGNTVPQGSLPDVGAYEFLVPNSASSLSQYQSDGTTSIAAGGGVNATSVVLKLNMSSDNSADSLTPQVEVRELGTDFTNTVTHSGDAVAYSGSSVTGQVTVTGLTIGKQYHWQARVSNSAGQGSWVSFGTNSESEPDFKTDITAPTGPSIISPSGYTKDDIRPVLKFKKSTDSGGGISTYTVTLDEGKNQSYSVGNLPSSGDGSASYVWKDDDQLRVEYLHEDDSDSSNDEILVYFKGLNDHPLSQGKHTWSVTAYDTASNTATSNADIYVDQSSSAISDLALADISTIYSGVTYYLTADQLDFALSGLVADVYAGSTVTNINGTQDIFEPVSSGPSSIDIVISQFKSGSSTTASDAVYQEYATKTYDLTDINDHTSVDKSTRFYFKTPQAIGTGFYKVQVTVTDHASNTSNSTIFYLSHNYSNSSLLDSIVPKSNLKTQIIDQEVIPKTTTDIAPTDNYSVRIKVVDLENNPVKNASVTIHSKVQQTYTDENGVAYFDQVEPGDHRVIIAYDDYEGEQKLNLSGDVAEHSLTIQVEPVNQLNNPLVRLLLIILIIVISAGVFIFFFLWSRHDRSFNQLFNRSQKS